jgi:hypothetical protein
VFVHCCTDRVFFYYIISHSLYVAISRNRQSTRLGIWSEHQIEQFQIRYRATFMSFSDEMTEEHEAMLTAVGEQQSSVWMFMPYLGVYLSKIGDAFNKTPIFFTDGASARALKRAEEIHEIFMATQEVERAPLLSIEPGRGDEGRKGDEQRSAEVARPNRAEPSLPRALSISVVKREPRNAKNADGSNVMNDTNVNHKDSEMREDEGGGGANDLPPGWTAVPSNSMPGKMVYRHTATGARTRMKPSVQSEHRLIENWQQDEEDSKGENQKAAEVSRNGQRRNEAPSSRSKAPQQQSAVAESSGKLKASEQKRRNEQSNLDGEVADDLPPGWTAVPSNSMPGKMVYRHTATGFRTEVKPTVQSERTFIEKCQQIAEEKRQQGVEESKGENQKAAEDSRNGQRRNGAPSSRSKTPQQSAVAESSGKLKASEQRRDASQNEEDAAEDTFTGLPRGWLLVPSQSKRGELEYSHAETGARSKEVPTPRNQRALITTWQNKLKEATELPNQSISDQLWVLQQQRQQQQSSAVAAEHTTNGKRRNQRRKKPSLTSGGGPTELLYDDTTSGDSTDSRDNGMGAALFEINHLSDDESVRRRKPWVQKQNLQRGQCSRRAVPREAAVRGKGRIEVARWATYMEGGAPPSMVTDENMPSSASPSASYPRRKKSGTNLDVEMAISDWLDDIYWGNSHRFGGLFEEKNLRKVRDLRTLDEKEFAALKTAIGGRRTKGKPSRKGKRSKKTAAVLESLDEMRECWFSQMNYYKPTSKDKEIEQGDEKLLKGQEAGGKGAGRDIDKGIYDIVYDASAKKVDIGSFQENRRYWIVDIPRPPNIPAHRGEGILVWFSHGSIIGSADSVAEKTCASVRFLEYKKDESGHNQHGQSISGTSAHYLFDFNTLSNAVQFGGTCAGRPGENLPSYDDPLFIPKATSQCENNSISCVLCLYCPEGTTPKFKLRACFAGETPLLGLKVDLKRRLQWFLHVSFIVVTFAIVLATGASQRAGILIFLVDCLAVSAIESATVYVSRFCFCLVLPTRNKPFNFNPSILLLLDLQGEHKHRYGGLWQNALDVIAHCHTVGMLCSAFLSCSFAALSTASVAHRENRSRVRPVMEPAVRTKKSNRGAAFSSGRLETLDEKEQLAIHKAIMSGLISTPDKKTDTIIEGEVSEWLRRRQRRNTVTTEDEAEFSEACRGLVSPHVCSKIIKDITQGDPIMDRHHLLSISQHLTAVHDEVIRQQEENAFYWDVIYGPADRRGISAYEYLLQRPES